MSITSGSATDAEDTSCNKDSIPFFAFVIRAAFPLMAGAVKQAKVVHGEGGGGSNVYYCSPDCSLPLGCIPAAGEGFLSPIWGASYKYTRG